MNDILSSRDCANRLRSTIDAAVQEVRRFGWCILKDIIPAAEADRICMKVLRVAAEVREGVGQTLGLINFEQSFAPYLAHPRILGLAEAFFGPFIRISETAAVVNHPGNPRGRWHADWPFNQGFAVRIQAPYPDTLLHLGTLWSLTPFSRSTGGTWILPGSHRLPHNPTGDLTLEPGSPRPGEEQVSAPAGSVIAYDSRLWHATATNRSPKPRVALAIRYAPWWLNLQGLKRGTADYEASLATGRTPVHIPALPVDVFERLPEKLGRFSPIGLALEKHPAHPDCDFSIRSQALAPIDGEPFFNGYLVGIRTPVVIFSCSPARFRGLPW